MQAFSVANYDLCCIKAAARMMRATTVYCMYTSGMCLKCGKRTLEKRKSEQVKRKRILHLCGWLLDNCRWISIFVALANHIEGPNI